MLIDFKLYFFVICLPTEHLGVLKNSLKRVRAFQMELDREVLVKEWGKQEYPEKNAEQWRRPTTNHAGSALRLKLQSRKNFNLKFLFQLMM